MILEYSKINKLGHYNIIYIKDISDINNYIFPILLLFDNGYNYDMLKKINS